MIREAIKKLAEKQNLTYEETVSCMEEIMSGRSNDISISNFLLGLKMKGETSQELEAMLDVMNELSVKIDPSVNGRLVDTCGTGGDKIRTFNVSTAAAFVAAAAGASVAKHGNRSMSGFCGSADVMESFGYNLNTEPGDIQNAIEQLGVGFMFAPRFHPAMKNVANARKQLGVRTAFNLLGPLSNPAGITAQVVGVSDYSLIEKIALVLRKIREESMVFYAQDGLDELSNTCINNIVWVRDGSINKFDLNPKSFNIGIADPADISVMSREESVETTFRVLNGTADNKKTGIALLNAAAALIVANKADSFQDAIELARNAIQSGKAYEKLRMLISRAGHVSKLEELEKRCQNS